jgi:hypothetical protein
MLLRQRRLSYGLNYATPPLRGCWLPFRGSGRSPNGEIALLAGRHRLLTGK